MVAAVTAPKPQQPSPVEFQQWNQATNNARTQYLNTLATNQYNRSQAGTAYQTGLRNLQYNQGLQRRQFDDPYIGRGVFNSGIRAQGLTDFGTNYYNQFMGLQNQYQGALGGYDVGDLNARATYNQSLTNARLAEQARRAQLAGQIQGII